MAGKKRKWFIGLAVFVVALVGLVLYALTIAGEFKEVQPHFDGECRLVPGMVGPEDMQLLADGSGALISSQDRHAHLAGKSANGTIYYYDLNDPNAQPIDLLPDAPEDFRPHGIGLYEADGAVRVFVVNHPRANLHGDIPGEGPAHTIEIYDFDAANRTLAHVKRVSDPELLITPNDVAPVGPDAFYATNDHASGKPAWRILEEFSRYRGSHIVYYDGQRFHRLPGEYRYANGIIASEGGKFLYMAAPADRSLYVFKRNPNDFSLQQEARIFTNSGLDNPTLDENGDVWVVAHVKMLTLGQHFKDATVHSPSQVLLIRPHAIPEPMVEEVYLDDGSQLSAGSVAARLGQRLLLGSVTGEGILDCVWEGGK